MKTILSHSPLNNSKIYIIDFEDSFTFNIAAEIYLQTKNVEVLSHLEFFKKENFNVFFKNIKESIGIILGPGPGSPAKYRHYFKMIEKLKKNPLVFLMGICLGHQLFALMEGLCIRPSLLPMHGDQIKIYFEGKWYLVQRYNSLAVYLSKTHREEIQIREWERGVSYQFHPESIGTNKRFIFFKKLINFVRSL